MNLLYLFHCVSCNRGLNRPSPFGPSWAAGPGIFGGSCILGLGLVKVRFKVSIGGRVRVSFFGSFRVRVRGGVRFWLGPGTRLDPSILE